MWPWGHLAVAYLLFHVYAHQRFARPLGVFPVFAVAVGSQVPDLLDKPLAWTFDVLPGGRTLGHCLLFAIMVVPAIYALSLRVDRLETGSAFVIGYLSHLITDLPPSILWGNVSGTEFLFWPFVDQPPEEPVDGILDAILTYYTLGPAELLQFGLFAVAVFVWYRDGMPGLEYVSSVLGRSQESNS